jgi:hypothetical protein
MTYKGEGKTQIVHKSTYQKKKKKVHKSTHNDLV